MTLFEEIQKAAYAIYEKSGRVGGKDLENWLEAEKAIKAMRARKEPAGTGADKPALAGPTAVEKAKKAVKKTSTGLKSAAKKKI